MESHKYIGRLGPLQIYQRLRPPMEHQYYVVQSTKNQPSQYLHSDGTLQSSAQTLENGKWLSNGWFASLSEVGAAYDKWLERDNSALKLLTFEQHHENGQIETPTENINSYNEALDLFNKAEFITDAVKAFAPLSTKSTSENWQELNSEELRNSLRAAFKGIVLTKGWSRTAEQEPACPCPEQSLSDTD